ncbi:MAG: DUF485 domain-containing protein [Planctomycetota bacterium]
MSKPLSEAERTNAKLGMWLFGVYLLLYAGFVFINAFSPDTMSNIVYAGLNLAVVYGFGLIFSAFVLAMIYGMACKREPAVPAENPNMDRGAGGEASSESGGGEQQ